MYRYLLPLIVLIIAVSSCTKNAENSCPPLNTVAPDSQVVALGHYIDTAGITATKDPRGFYYTILDTGVGVHPTPCNQITASYSGKLLDGTVFDSNHNSSFVLNQLIPGWQEGIPLIKTGGRIVLYLPPALGYGSNATTVIPSNSSLIFTIELLSVR
jgi:FKBP-type peptidyl-prolyl cis-trans isomerase FkpA